jgi:hypothetical protein
MPRATSFDAGFVHLLSLNQSVSTYFRTSSASRTVYPDDGKQCIRIELKWPCHSQMFAQLMMLFGNN